MSPEREQFSKPAVAKHLSRAKNALIIVAVMTIGLYLAWDRTSSQMKSLVVASIDLILHGKNDNYQLLGELGGVPVAIHREGVFAVEYDDQDLYREQRKALPSDRMRTVKDKLASFGFKVRFPDMGIGTPEVLSRERGKSNIFTTMWINVGVSSNSDYKGGTESLERLVNTIQKMFDSRGSDYQYRRHTELVHGLVAYHPFQRIVSPQGKVLWQRFEENSFYYHVDEDGKVDTYIMCSYVKYASSPCSQYFLLLPKMLAMARLGYRNELLPHWRQMQDSVRKVILGFAIGQESSNLPR
jgi:hypothetical protein